MPRFFFGVRFFFLLAALLPAEASSQSIWNSRIRGTRLEVDIYGNMFVVETERNVVRLYSKDTVLVREIGGQGWDNNQFDRPSGIWARNGIDVFVADYGNHRIQRFDRSLNYVATFSTHDSDNPDERFGYPTDVAVSRLGDLYICDSENTRIVKVDRFSQVERVFGGFDAGKGRLENPTRIEIGPHDYIYVLDATRILVYDTFGNFLHELAPGVFKNLQCLYADNRRILVTDGTTIYCFDENERLASSTLLQTLTGSEQAVVHSVALHKDTIYLLVPGGLLTAPGPCVPGAGDNLDK